MCCQTGYFLKILLYIDIVILFQYMLRIKFISFAFIDFISEPEANFNVQSVKRTPTVVIRCRLPTKDRTRTPRYGWLSSLLLFFILFSTANSMMPECLSTPNHNSVDMLLSGFILKIRNTISHVTVCCKLRYVKK